jgi:hypothetical protein
MRRESLQQAARNQNRRDNIHHRLALKGTCPAKIFNIKTPKLNIPNVHHLFAPSLFEKIQQQFPSPRPDWF